MIGLLTFNLADLTEDHLFPYSNWESFFKIAGFNDILVKQFTQLFKKHEIEYDMINELTHEVLLQMGVNKAGQRIKILRMRFKHNFDIEGTCYKVNIALNCNRLQFF